MLNCWKRGAALMALVWACLLAGCVSGPQGMLRPQSSAKGETFGYRQWVSPAHEQDVVVIGIHGFCGASIDYNHLGQHLLKHQPETALYAYELRGQGSDPTVSRRGDIADPAEWYRDLGVFTEWIRKRHPQARVVWYGESMGALIAVHAWCKVSGKTPPCEGLVLSSPIVRFPDHIPPWTPGVVQTAAATVPLARISLQTLMGGQEIQMTQNSFHGQQVAKNPYHVGSYTLRLLGTLARLIDGMNACAPRLRGPVLILHGGRDTFNKDRDIRGFVARMGEGARVTYRNYPKAYHLLMYDALRDQVFRDFEAWLDRFRG